MANAVMKCVECLKSCLPLFAKTLDLKYLNIVLECTSVSMNI